MPALKKKTPLLPSSRSNKDKADLPKGAAWHETAECTATLGFLLMRKYDEVALISLMDDAAVMFKSEGNVDQKYVAAADVVLAMSGVACAFAIERLELNHRGAMLFVLRVAICASTGFYDSMGIDDADLNFFSPTVSSDEAETST